MADILIRGMEMPECCAYCHDADLAVTIAMLGAKCPWCSGIIDPGTYDLRHGRHPDCPLDELPPHGDLIDRDAIPYTDTYNGLIAEMDQIDRLPVVVSSNKEGLQCLSSSSL